jgi:hypothetical protein
MGGSIASDRHSGNLKIRNICNTESLGHPLPKYIQYFSGQSQKRQLWGRGESDSELLRILGGGDLELWRVWGLVALPSMMRYKPHHLHITAETEWWKTKHFGAASLLSVVAVGWDPEIWAQVQQTAIFSLSLHTYGVILLLDTCRKFQNQQADQNMILVL